jgi:hypothetical protein
VNKFVSEGAIPIFWGGHVRIEKGFGLNYQQNIFHARRVFSLDWGANISYWKTRYQEEFFTVSIYPVLRFTFLRSKNVDCYLNYSVAGPSFISKTFIDLKDTGKKFTFHDFMGLGAYWGSKRKLNTEISIAHYSNGNIFPQNNGIMIPLTFKLGYTFQ